MSLAQRQTPGFVSYPAATNYSRRCSTYTFYVGGNSPFPLDQSYHKPIGSAMSPAQRGTGRAKKASGKLPTRFQPYRSVAPRPPRFHHFLKLPAEIRIQIYRHLVKQPDAIDVCGIWNDRPTAKIAGLFRANRQIHAESTHVFYTINTFCLLEQCDQWNGDSDLIETNPWNIWLNKIGTANALSLRHVQLRIRHERNIDYYAQQIKELATQSPRICRLAIVVEKHASTPSLGAGLRLMWNWEPNQVNQLTLCKLSKLVPSVAMLKDLNILVLAGSEQRQFLDTVCSLFQVRIQVIDEADAKRDLNACQLLWDQKKLYDGILVKGSPGRIIRSGKSAAESEYLIEMGEADNRRNDNGESDGLENSDDNMDLDEDEDEDDSGVAA